MHVFPFLHFLLQPPQCLVLNIVFTHCPLQQVSENLHFFPHMPQLSASVITFTHFFLQQYGPGLPLARQTVGYLSHVFVWSRGDFRLEARKRPATRNEVVNSSSSTFNRSSSDSVAASMRSGIVIVAMSVANRSNEMSLREFIMNNAECFGCGEEWRIGEVFILR